MKLTSTNPGKNYQVIGEVEFSSEEEVVEKVKKAHLAKDSWREIGLEKRIEILRGLVESFSNKKEELALLITKEMGMPISQSRAEMMDAIKYFNWYLDNASKYLSSEITYEDETQINKVFYEPLGVGGVIVPWNFPLSNLVWACGESLIAGNTIVFKHSEECPLFGKLLEEIVNKVLPEGVFNEVYGDEKVGDFLAHQKIDLICFTGSTQTGQSLYKIAAEKFMKCVLEMGGSAPGIIFEDAKIDEVLETIYMCRFSNAGQMCDALKRLIVSENKMEEVKEKLKGLLSTKKVGDPEKEDTEIGPLVAKRQLELLEEQIKDAVDKGAKIVCGGRRPEGLEGAYYEPTILTNITKEMRIWQEEVFGPVLPIVTFDTEEKAIRMANDTKYGLGAYIYTKDPAKALRIASKLESAMVNINNASYINPASPFGGVKLSGMGREHGKFGFAEVTFPKVVAYSKDE